MSLPESTQVKSKKPRPKLTLNLNTNHHIPVTKVTPEVIRIDDQLWVGSGSVDLEKNGDIRAIVNVGKGTVEGDVTNTNLSELEFGADGVTALCLYLNSSYNTEVFLKFLPVICWIISALEKGLGVLIYSGDCVTHIPTFVIATIMFQRKISYSEARKEIKEVCPWCSIPNSGGGISLMEFEIVLQDFFSFASDFHEEPMSDRIRRYHTSDRYSNTAASLTRHYQDFSYNPNDPAFLTPFTPDQNFCMCMKQFVSSPRQIATSKDDDDGEQVVFEEVGKLESPCPPPEEQPLACLDTL